jgi:hypothetical protein
VATHGFVTTTLALAGFWMLLWASFGAVLSTIAGLIDPAVIGPGEGPADVARILAGVGLAAGAAFGVLLAVAERGRTLTEVPFLRIVMWGVLAGCVPRLIGLTGGTFFNLIPLGALSAALCVATVRLARLRWFSSI